MALGVGAARPAAQLPRRARWTMLALLTTFAGVGVVLAHHRSLALVVVGAVATIGGGLLILEPRRAPVSLSAAVATAGIGLLCNGVASNLGWFAVVVIAGWCALTGGRPVALAYWAAAAGLFAGEWLWAGHDPGWAAWVAGTTLTTLAALLIRHEVDLVTQLRAAQAGLTQRAQAEERNRIARELHDVIAHSLIVSLLHVTSARLAVEHDPADAARSLAEAERLGRECLAEVRRTVGLLRHDDDGHDGTAPPLPGVGDVPALVERFRAAGAKVALTVDGDTRELPATSGLAVYRILQEALTNAARHAPGSPITVGLIVEPDELRLAVHSTGRPGNGSGLGLLSMRERAELLGGSCEAGPSRSGWTVRADLPLDASSRRGVAA